MINRLRYVILCSETVAVRFWFGLVTLGFAMFSSQIQGHWEYDLALKIMPAIYWSALFAVNGAALLVGVFTQRFSFILMMAEGALGTFVWTVMGISVSMAQGVPGATLFASLVAIWILMRYPTWR